LAANVLAELAENADPVTLPELIDIEEASPLLNPSDTLWSIPHRNCPVSWPRRHRPNCSLCATDHFGRSRLFRESVAKEIFAELVQFEEGVFEELQATLEHDHQSVRNLCVRVIEEVVDRDYELGAKGPELVRNTVGAVCDVATTSRERHTIRENAGKTISGFADDDPELFSSRVGELSEELARVDASIRTHFLEVLAEVASYDPDTVK
jgi:hypothetical protein